jgi:acyl-CoA reductase-like NAD-dependent aldehyde dehydrogenase
VPLLDSTPTAIDAATEAAASAADEWASSGGLARAALLHALADDLDASAEACLSLALEETGLGRPRLGGELARTTFQLRGFARCVSDGKPFATLDDPAIAGAAPKGHPHLTRVRVPVGPVAIFAAGNFPLAFSVLGGDSASALAAGCPVVVKAHPGHPALSRHVFEVAKATIKRLRQPDGLLGLVQGASTVVGQRLVMRPEIRAVAFTGSFRGGAALQREIHGRRNPVPFFGELGSINPVVVLPGAAQQSGERLAAELAASIAQGSGQFCTSPGIVIVCGDHDSQTFVKLLQQALEPQPTHRMLTTDIRRRFELDTATLATNPNLSLLLYAPGAQAEPRPFLALTDAAAFAEDRSLHDEVFGPSCIVVRASSAADVIKVLGSIAGTLTATIWGAEAGDDDARSIAREAMRIAGRVLFAGVPTGVAVTGAQQHGGPWPSSTMPSTTSVGYLAMDRFLRPVALQDAPSWLLDRHGVPL